MSSSIAESTASFPTMSLLDGQDLWSGTSTDQEVIPGWMTLKHGDEISGPLYPCDIPVKIEAMPVHTELGPQPNFHPFEAVAAEFCDPRTYDESQTQPQAEPRRTRERGTTQNTRGRGRRTTTRGGVLPICVECNIAFSRLQEFKRHWRDLHQPRRPCPFCGFKFLWSRPDKIKAHIIAEHQDELYPGMLAEIEPWCGRQIVAFVDAFITDPYGQGLGAEATFHSLFSEGSSLS